MEYLGEESGTSRRLLGQGLPVHNFSVKYQKSPVPFRPSLCQSDMNGVEVCHHLCHYKVHGTDFTNQLIHIFPENTALCGQKTQKGKELLEISRWEGNCACVHVNRPPQDFLDTFSASLPLQDLLDAHQVLCLNRQGQEDPLEGSDGAAEEEWNSPDT